MRRSQRREARGRRRWARRLVVLVAWFLAGTAVGLALLWHLAPYPADRLTSYPASARIVDREERTLRVYPGENGEFRLPVPLADMSPWLARAIVAVEDRRFRSHPGIDLAAIGRAALRNARDGRVTSGASTLSQQLVRILDDRPRTWSTKLVEAFRALQLESQRSKDELLEAYLNLAPMGGNLRGVEAAARRYLGKSCRDLTLAEAALLAGLPQSPSRLRPDRHLERAFARRRTVLQALLRVGAISPAEAEAAAAERTRVALHPWPLEAPHFCDWLRREGLAAVDGSVPVRSTLDPEIQRRAEEELSAFCRGDPASRRRLSGAVVVLEAATGAVRAMVGSPGYFEAERRGMINAALQPRSPGSALKPFTYALAFDRGLIAPETSILDLPVAYRGFVPENFDRLFHGPLPAAEALARSLNVPAVRLQAQLGTVALLEALRELGMRSLRQPAGHYGLTLTLGSGEVTLLELTCAYAALVRGGEAVAATGILPAGRGATPAGGRVFSPGACRLVLESLAHADHLRQAAAAVLEGRERPLGFKTGTSPGLRDAWAVAFTPGHVVGVWLGDPEGRAHPDLVGVRAAAPIALALCRSLPDAGPDDWPGGGGVESRPICADSGALPNPTCPVIARGRFPATSPACPLCPLHRRHALDVASGFELCASCAAGRETRDVIATSWPPEVEAWRRRRGLESEPALPPHAPWCRELADGSPPRILTPVEGAEYSLDGDRAPQRLLLSAAAPQAAGRLHWFVNGGPIATAAAGESVAWPLEPGAHSIRCVDDRGRVAAVQIRVR